MKIKHSHTFAYIFHSSSRRKDVDEYYWVFKLNKNGRVICMKQKRIIYLISIDTQFNQ